MNETTIVGDSVGLGRSTWQSGWADTWSGVSWSAVIAGAITAIAVSFILISLGTGIGMELVSPYSYSSSPSASTMTIIGALWLVFSQAVGFATGAYVTARLRRPPAGLHTSEVKFRDGANGLIVWAIGVVVTFFVLVAAVDKIGAAASTAAAGTATVGLAGATSQTPSIDYFTDSLLRPNSLNAAQNAGQNVGNAGAPNGTPATASGTDNNGASSASPSNGGSANGGVGNQQRAQINRILLTSLGPAGLSNDDRTYLTQTISARTGMSQDEAQRRVDDVVNRAKQDAKQAAETARKAAAYLSFWTFMSLLFGAVCATLGGIAGGDLRDEVATRYAVPAAPR